MQMKKQQKHLELYIQPRQGGKTTKSMLQMMDILLSNPRYINNTTYLIVHDNRLKIHIMNTLKDRGILLAPHIKDNILSASSLDQQSRHDSSFPLFLRGKSFDGEVNVIIDDYFFFSKNVMDMIYKMWQQSEMVFRGATKVNFYIRSTFYGDHKEDRLAIEMIKELKKKFHLSDVAAFIPCQYNHLLYSFLTENHDVFECVERCKDDDFVKRFGDEKGWAYPSIRYDFEIMNKVFN